MKLMLHAFFVWFLGKLDHTLCRAELKIMAKDACSFTSEFGVSALSATLGEPTITMNSAQLLPKSVFLEKWVQIALTFCC